MAGGERPVVTVDLAKARDSGRSLMSRSGIILSCRPCAVKDRAEERVHMAAKKYFKYGSISLTVMIYLVRDVSE